MTAEPIDHYSHLRGKRALVIGCGHMTEEEYKSKYSDIQEVHCDPHTHGHLGSTTICQNNPKADYQFDWGDKTGAKKMYDQYGRPRFSFHSVILYECLGWFDTQKMKGVVDVVRAFNGKAGYFIIEALNPIWLDMSSSRLVGNLAHERKMSLAVIESKDGMAAFRVERTPLTDEEKALFLKDAPKLEGVDPLYLLKLSLLGFDDFELRRENPITGRKGLFSLCCRYDPKHYLDPSRRSYQLLKLIDPAYTLEENGRLSVLTLHGTPLEFGFSRSFESGFSIIEKISDYLPERLLDEPEPYYL